MSREEDYDRWPDACVAVAVFGWKWFSMSRGDSWIAREPEYVDGMLKARNEPPENAPLHFANNLPRYTTDPAADYSVFCEVRKWDGDACHAFWDALGDILQGKFNEFLAGNGFGPQKRDDYSGDPLNMMAWYQPGDYSRAALAVLKAESTP